MLRPSAADYREQLWQLMPRGLAWSRVKGGAEDLLLAGLAGELARLDGRAVYLALYEFYGQSTRELLPEWEFEYGLPDECGDPGDTYELRILELLRKIRALGGQSRAYFIGLAKALGYEVEIDEPLPFRAGLNRAGERLCGREWRHVWHVTGPEVQVFRFRSGRNRAGERLRHWRGLDRLECLFNKLKPAHTWVIFGYREQI